MDEYVSETVDQMRDIINELAESTPDDTRMVGLLTSLGSKFYDEFPETGDLYELYWPLFHEIIDLATNYEWSHEFLARFLDGIELGMWRTHGPVCLPVCLDCV